MLSVIPDENFATAIPILDNMSKLLKTTSNPTFRRLRHIPNLQRTILSLDIDGTTGWGKMHPAISWSWKKRDAILVIPGLQFGNIFIGPEPQRGWEADINLLYHSM
jgi:cobaltochelatase CobN